MLEMNTNASSEYTPSFSLPQPPTRLGSGIKVSSQRSVPWVVSPRCDHTKVAGSVNVWKTFIAINVVQWGALGDSSQKKDEKHEH